MPQLDSFLPPISSSTPASKPTVGPAKQAPTLAAETPRQLPVKSLPNFVSNLPPKRRISILGDRSGQRSGQVSLENSFSKIPQPPINYDYDSDNMDRRYDSVPSSAQRSRDSIDQENQSAAGESTSFSDMPRSLRRKSSVVVSWEQFKASRSSRGSLQSTPSYSNANLHKVVSQSIENSLSKAEKQYNSLKNQDPSLLQQHGGTGSKPVSRRSSIHSIPEQHLESNDLIPLPKQYTQSKRKSRYSSVAATPTGCGTQTPLILEEESSIVIRPSATARETARDMMMKKKSFAPNPKELSRLLDIALKSIEDHPVDAFQMVDSEPLNLVKVSGEGRVLSEGVKKQWIELFRAHMWANRSTKAGKKCALRLLKSVHHLPYPEDTGMVVEMQKDMDVLFRIQELLKIRCESRTGYMIQALDKILKSRVIDYAKMSDADRYQLCRVATLEKHNKDTVLLWEEYALTCFHILLTGRIEIFKINKSQKLPLALIKSGSMLGHARAKVEGATRTACAIVASDDSYFLAIDKVAFLGKVKKDPLKSPIDARTLVLQTTSKFFMQQPIFFSKIGVFFEYQVWEKGDVIQMPNKQIDYLYWIISGECRVSRQLPYISKTAMGRTVYRPFDPKDEFFAIKTHEFEEKMVDFEVETQENLVQGDWFPYLPVTQEKVDELGIEKEIIFKSRSVNHCNFKFTADSKAAVVKVLFEDFVDIASISILQDLKRNQMVQDYDLLTLQKAYLEKRAWDSYKREITLSIVKS